MEGFLFIPPQEILVYNIFIRYETNGPVRREC